MIFFEWPLALLGLGALALPIAVHALARRTPNELALPTVRFLDAAPRARRALALPQDRLVLLLRCLALAALALAASRPWLEDEDAAARPGRLIAVLDDSLSMAHGSRFARAKERLTAALAALPAGSRAALLTTSEPRGELVPVAEALERLRAATPSARASSLAPALEAAAALRAPDATVLVASDLDRLALEGVARRSEAARALRLDVIDVGDDEPHDASFAELAVTPWPAVAGEPVTVSARVRAVGLGEEPLRVGLELDGTRVAEKRVRPGERVSFELPPPRSSLVQGALALLPDPERPGPKDELALDDRAFFAARVLRKVSVALLGADASRRNAQGREQPVIDALAALARAQGLSVDVAVLSEPELGAGLAPASVLILAAPGELEAKTRERVAKFVTEGGGLVLLLDERVPDATLRLLAEKGVLPATARGLESGPATPPHLEDGFEPALARALAALALAPQAGLGPLPGTNALLASSSGEPLWVEKGRVVVLGFAPWGRNAALAREAAFPLLVRRAFRAALGSAEMPRLECGGALNASEIGKLVGVSAESVSKCIIKAPSPALPRCAGEGGSLSVSLDSPGIYQVESEDRVVGAIAVNANEREALLERASEGERGALRGAGAASARREDGRDLTLPCVALGVVFLLLASLAANRGLLALAPKKRPAREKVTT